MSTQVTLEVLWEQEVARSNRVAPIFHFRLQPETGDSRTNVQVSRQAILAQESTRIRSPPIRTEHIGVSHSDDNHEIKRKLKPALKELQGIGFLADSSPETIFRRTKPGKWQITVSKAGPKVAVNAASSRWETELTSRGISRNVARKLAEEFSADHFAEKICMHDALVARRDRRVSKNAAGFLAAAIRDDYGQSLRRAADFWLPPKTGG